MNLVWPSSSSRWSWPGPGGWPAVVGKSPDGPAARPACTGDTIVAVDGRSVAYWEDLDRVSRGQRPPLNCAHAATRPTDRGGYARSTHVPTRSSRPRGWDLGAGPAPAHHVSGAGVAGRGERAQPGDVVTTVRSAALHARGPARGHPYPARPVVRADRRARRCAAHTDRHSGAGEGARRRARDRRGQIQAGLAPRRGEVQPIHRSRRCGRAVKTWDMTV
jgi:hypothetical protein